MRRALRARAIASGSAAGSSGSAGVRSFRPVARSALPDEELFEELPDELLEELESPELPASCNGGWPTLSCPGCCPAPGWLASGLPASGPASGSPGYGNRFDAGAPGFAGAAGGLADVPGVTGACELAGASEAAGASGFTGVPFEFTGTPLIVPVAPSGAAGRFAAPGWLPDPEAGAADSPG